MAKAMLRGGEVLPCGTCLDAGGIADSEPIEGARRGTMDELAERTRSAERVPLPWAPGPALFTVNRPMSPRQTRMSANEALWPPADYWEQIERLRAAVGATVYLAELAESPVQLGIRLTDTPYVLLGIVDFPRPDPTRGLAPHLVLLDDGRGVNLGRIARIGRRPFAPAPEDLLYLDRAAHRDLLFSERRLSQDFLARRSRVALGRCLGYSDEAIDRPPSAKLAGPGDPGGEETK